MRFDHHCAFLGTCIGVINYRWFIILITSITIYAALALSMIYASLREANHLLDDPDAIVMFLVSLGVLLAFMALDIYHLFITGKNLTTNEHVKRYYKINPFDHGYLKNYRHVFFRPYALLPTEEAPQVSTTYARPQTYNSDCLSDLYDN